MVDEPALDDGLVEAVSMEFIDTRDLRLSDGVKNCESPSIRPADIQTDYMTRMITGSETG